MQYLRPKLIVFDVNETLTSLEPLRERLGAAGADPALLEVWFAATLRDGIALTAAGGFATFPEVARAALARLAPEADAAMATKGFSDPQPHADVGPALNAMSGQGQRLITLSNGDSDTARVVLERAGAAETVEDNLSVNAVGRWKPAAAAYEYACRTCGVAPAEALLVSVHPWDLAGADRAGLKTCFVDRERRGYPDYLEIPQITITALTELADHVG